MTTPIQSTPTPTSVYKYYDSAGLLLYVGMTRAGINRNRQHNADKEWWQWVVTQRVDHFKSTEAAHAAEVRLIQKYRPPFNRQHNHGHEEIANAYRAIRASGEYRLAMAAAKEPPKVGPMVAGFEVVAHQVGHNTVVFRSTLPVARTVLFNQKRPLVCRGQIIGNVRGVVQHPGFTEIDTHVKFGWKVPRAFVELKDGYIRKVEALGT